MENICSLSLAAGFEDLGEDIIFINGGQDVKCQGCEFGYLVGQFVRAIVTGWGNGASHYDDYRRETGFGK
ncbi:hypothetical protein [Arsenicibacter rosenii]|uniref:hypothetical protein n=1 Tax=Arsenicibacter rosenii TaxID=1750698 RepID=UPI0011608A9F|nr:hypothetical protein [Arsenicibacter rosenii]